jgi:hypothetical protein
MELRDALDEISEIRLRVAETQVFRGYRAAPVACSGLLAVAAAAAQQTWIPEPGDALGAYLLLWSATAAASVLVIGMAMLLRRRLHSCPVRRSAGVLALESLVPSLVAGGVVTVAIVRYAPWSAVLLPGLWQILFSLGLFASSRLLPRAIVWVALFYLVTGGLCLSLAGRGDGALAPWAMGIPFGAGQLLSAAILYWSLERTDAGR